VSSNQKLLVVLSVAFLAWGVSGCGSDSNSPTAPVDTAPPAVPTDLTAIYEGDQVTVSWAQNVTDSDFAGFTLARSNNGQTVELISVPSAVTMYADANPAIGVSEYAVAAVDQVGNQSAFRTVSVTIQRQHAPVDPRES
jgi:hypothetical protein